MSLAEVRLQEGESLENALRRFKRKVQTEDIIKEVKRHSYYLKPGEKRRLKQALASVPAKRIAESRIKLQQLGPLPPNSGLPFRRTRFSAGQFVERSNAQIQGWRLGTQSTNQRGRQSHLASRGWVLRRIGSE
jgi:small subunit ribosomal protein S21